MRAYNIETEVRRFGKDVTPRCDRHCKYCFSIATKTIGDEIHFVMMCPQFHEKRILLEAKIVDCTQNVRHLSFHYKVRGEWPSGLNSLRQVTEVKLGRVRSDFGWVTTEA